MFVSQTKKWYKNVRKIIMVKPTMFFLKLNKLIRHYVNLLKQTVNLQIPFFGLFRHKYLFLGRGFSLNNLNLFVLYGLIIQTKKLIYDKMKSLKYKVQKAFFSLHNSTGRGLLFPDS